MIDNEGNQKVDFQNNQDDEEEENHHSNEEFDDLLQKWYGLILEAMLVSQNSYKYRV
jgi:hypothetical protein